MKQITTSSLLAGSGIFAELSEEERSAVERHSTYLEFNNDDEVFHEGEPADTFYVIQRGEVLIRQHDDELHVRDVARFIAGESFGEIDVLRGTERSADAVAGENTLILAFPAPPERFRDVLDREPVVFARVLQKLIAFLAGRIRSTNQLLSRNSAWMRELRRQVYSDKLTGLYNTSFLKDTLKEFPPAEKAASSILMLKPDRFKDINDTYGHEVGDRTIRLLARTFQENVEKVGSAVRYRGNELAAILPGMDRDASRELASSLRAAVLAIDISDMTGGERVEISTSIGIAVAPDDGVHVTDGPVDADGAAPVGERLLQLAYDRLMRARNNGGGRTYDQDDQANRGSNA